jgi:hypothetical protein
MPTFKSIDPISDSDKTESKISEVDKTIVETVDLNKYAEEMSEEITLLKKRCHELSDNELKMMIEQNKVCKAMFQQVFNVLVTEQVKRMNEQSKQIDLGIAESEKDS